MINQLETWLNMRAGAAPVSIVLCGNDTPVEELMIAVDATGVMVSKSGLKESTAYPWNAIVSISTRP